MKDEVRTKIFLDLFAAPGTLIPFIGGLTAIIISWIFGSSLLAASGIIGTCIGTCIFLTKFIFGLDKITQDAYQYEIQKKENETNKRLNDLDARLRQDRDPRPEISLRQLRVLYKTVQERAKTNPVGSQLMENFDRLFQVCIAKIEDTDKIWRDSRNTSDSNKRALMKKREKIVEEIEQVTAELQKTVQQFQVMEDKKTDSEMADLRKEFEQTLLVAKKTEERLTNLHNSESYDPKEFE